MLTKIKRPRLKNQKNIEKTIGMISYIIKNLYTEFSDIQE